MQLTTQVLVFTISFFSFLLMSLFVFTNFLLNKSKIDALIFLCYAFFFHFHFFYYFAVLFIPLKLACLCMQKRLAYDFFIFQANMQIFFLQEIQLNHGRKEAKAKSGKYFWNLSNILRCFNHDFWCC